MPKKEKETKKQRDSDSGKKSSKKQEKELSEEFSKNVVLEEKEDLPMKDLTSGFSLVVANTIGGDLENISISGFSITSGKTKVLFQDAELVMSFGRKYGIIGKNGIGKSTLLKHLAEKKLPVHPKMDILYVEQEIEATKQFAVQVVLSSNPRRNELLFKLEKLRNMMEDEQKSLEVDVDELEELENEWNQSGFEKSEYEARKILNGLGFKREQQDQPVELFSGGWRMRISLAQALFRKPSVLMLDEPSNHLDLNAVIWLIDYLSHYKKSVVVISHDKHFLNEVCTDIIHISDRKCMQYSGNYDKFLKSRQRIVAAHLKEWEKVEKKVKDMKKKGTPKKEVDAYMAKCGVTRPEKDYVVNIAFYDPGKLNGVVIDAENVSFQYDGRYIFKNLKFAVTCDSRVAIVGPNGVGKSTLLRILIGDLAPETGEVRRNSQCRIGYYSQHFASTLPEDTTPLEYLMGLYNKYAKDDDGRDKANNEQSVRKLMGTIGLESELHKEKIGKFSGGQKARVAFLSLFVTRPHILLLDEPSNHLDLETLEALIGAINEYDGGVVIVSHDIELISKTECQLYSIDEGTYAIHPYDGEYEDYRDEVLAALDQE